MEVPGPDKIQSFQDILVSVEGTEGEEKAQGVQLVFQRETFWVRSFFYGKEGRRAGKQGGGPETSGLASRQGVAGRMRFAEAVTVKAHHHLPDILYHFHADTPLTSPLNKSGIKVTKFFSLCFLLSNNSLTR